MLDMLEANRPEIRQRLWEQLDKARAEHLAPIARFDPLIREIPAEFPHPDGSLGVQRAGKDSRSALESYVHALKRFTDFVLNGTIPEDLLLPTQPERAAVGRRSRLRFR